MKNKLLVLFLTISLVFCSTFTAFADTTQLIEASILMDGNAINDTNIKLYTNKEGVKMYPLRDMAKSLGAKVSWNSVKNNAVIKTQDREIWLDPTASTITLNGVNKKLGYDIEVENSIIYVPAEFIYEIVGGRFQLDVDNQTINFDTPSETLENMGLSSSERNMKDVLAAYLTSLEINRNFSGQILVVNDGKILIDRAYGYSDYENQIKAYNSTTFGIGSVTKQFTAAAIVQLVEKGLISYDDKLSKYINDAPFADEITIHQLLTHTSGLYDFTKDLPNLAVSEFKLSELTFKKLLTFIQEKPLDFQPGSNFAYCNTNYVLLGEIVERISGQTLENYFQENLFAPAGMINTGVAYRLQEKLVEANGYTGHMEVVRDQVDMVLLNMAYGAGFLASTAEDLYRWNIALQEGKIVAMESLDKMFGRDTNMNLAVPYAYGLMFNKGALGEAVFHGGNTIGFTSLNAIFPQKDTQVIILTNKGYADLNSIQNNILSILMGNEVAPVEELVSIAVSEDQMNKYVGKYEINGILKIDIFIEAGKLMFQGENQPAIEMTPLSDTRFEATAFGIAIEFDSKDEPKAFILEQAGMKFKAEKK